MVLSEAEFFRAWIQQHLDLIQAEREAEVEETALLFSKSSQHLLALNGLALLNLSPCSVSVGLGGKTLIELEPDQAYHSSPALPQHTFKPGDLAGLAKPEKGGKEAKSGKEKEKEQDQIQGVVSKVLEGKIVLAVDDAKRPQSEELDIPQRCALWASFLCFYFFSS